MIINDKEEYVVTLIMAAGKGTRMKSDKSKLVQKIYDKELVVRVEELAEEIESDEIIAVVGYLREQVQDALKNKTKVKYAYQEELLGTGHAVMQAKDYLKGKKGKVVILYGDVPILRKETVKKLITKCIDNKESATVLSAIYENPTGYGRIIRDEGGSISAIVEEKDANYEQKLIKEINSGIYCFDIEELLSALEKITPNNAQGEYYLTDVIKIMNDKGLKIGTLIVEDDSEILGVNDRIQLDYLSNVLKRRINEEHMRNGVSFVDSNNTYIYENVKIGKDTVIYPNVTIMPGAVIGNGCVIKANTYIGNNIEITDKTEIKFGSIIE